VTPENREELELALVRSYEQLVRVKLALVNPSKEKASLYAELLEELKMQRYLHALLGEKGEPPGLLY
jgi:hypothetical protein